VQQNLHRQECLCYKNQAENDFFRSLLEFFPSKNKPPAPLRDPKIKMG